MKKLSTNKKEELGAHISSFSFSGFNAHFSRDMTRYKTFIGRDFKLLAQLAVQLQYHRVWMVVKKKCGLSYQRSIQVTLVIALHVHVQHVSTGF